MYRQLWTGLTTSQGNTLAALTNTTYNPNWPNNPNANYTRVFTNFETVIFAPNPELSIQSFDTSY